MATDYRARLAVPVEGPRDIHLFVGDGSRLCVGYTRVVLGGRGPYVEMDERHVDVGNLVVPYAERWRLTSPGRAYYEEYRTFGGSWVKVYRQLRTVDYADYVVGMFYASPFDLRLVDGTVLIRSLREGRCTPS